MLYLVQTSVRLNVYLLNSCKCLDVLDALKNPDVAQQVVDTWAEHFQKIVGKAVIRAVLYILGAAALFAAAKFNLWDKLFK